MEVAVMSLTTREQQALDAIENRLAGSDPNLAALLATFARLTSGEGMPAREQVCQEIRCTRQVFRRAWRRLAAYAGLNRALALLWVLVAIGLIAVAAALSGFGGGAACVKPWAAACTAPVPAHSSRPVMPSSS
jgi:hypothetical protein